MTEPLSAERITTVSVPRTLLFRLKERALQQEKKTGRKPTLAELIARALDQADNDGSEWFGS